jgi:hypothetical protein
VKAKGMTLSDSFDKAFSSRIMELGAVSHSPAANQATQVDQILQLE